MAKSVTTYWVQPYIFLPCLWVTAVGGNSLEAALVICKCWGAAGFHLFTPLLELALQYCSSSSSARFTWVPSSWHGGFKSPKVQKEKSKGKKMTPLFLFSHRYWKYYFSPNPCSENWWLKANKASIDSEYKGIWFITEYGRKSIIQVCPLS